ncbi:hypothetical protein QTP70_031938 [Hemibagrus guttatus]|uniref:Uncharacterized protein n=1 Tax=Hemibagrus guttatus TaxID=175788 RepID=A0AAE0PUQ1_9TELE|nr:hypothetical protein QTP70_031938 [Hemibagrus guttatus]
MKGSRPDWLLYVVPSIAFIVGLWLFSKIYRTQRRREKALQQVAALKNVMNTTSVGHTYTRYTRTSEQGSGFELWCLGEHMELRFRQQISGSSLCSDYVTPDADTDEVTETEKSIYLQPLQNLTDTDGESYENMEGSVYAHPRKPTKKNALSVEDDDYINPDGETKPNLEHMDTESYENMAGLACPDINTQPVDEGVAMNAWTENKYTAKIRTVSR